MSLQSAQALTKQGHTVVLYTFERSEACFPELQKGLDIRVWDSARKIAFFPLRKPYAMVSLAWELRHVDIIIANNPPMQIVAATTKLFVSRVETIWWHHHIPWYLSESKGFISTFSSKNMGAFMTANFWKGLAEKLFIIPRIDLMVATSYFVAEKIQAYCQREANVIHPILNQNYIPLPAHSSGAAGETKNHILFTHGRLEPGKGIDMILRVWE